MLFDTNTLARGLSVIYPDDDLPSGTTTRVLVHQCESRRVALTRERDGILGTGVRWKERSAVHRDRFSGGTAFQGKVAKLQS